MRLIQAIRMTCQFLIFFLFVYKIEADWTVLDTGTIQNPAHLFTVFLSHESTLNGLLTWNNKLNLEIYLFRQGDNVLKNEKALKSFTQTTDKSRAFQFVSQQSSTYFVRVFTPNLMNYKFVGYQLKLITTNQSIFHQGIIFKNYETSFTVIIPNNFQYFKIGFKYDTDSQEKTAVLSSPIAYPNLTVSSKQIACISGIFSPSFYLLIFPNSATSAYSLTDVNFNLSYFGEYTNCSRECPQNYLWDIGTQLCIYPPLLYTQNETSLTGFIWTTIIKCLIFLGAVAIVGIFLFRCYKYGRRQIRLKSVERRNLIKIIELSEVSMQFGQDCSICLGSNCDAGLPCNHRFHERCIKEWIRNKNICPLCRTQVK